MHNYCNNCSSCSSCNQIDCQYKIYNTYNNCSSECDQYKKRSDELYIEAKYIQEESNDLIYRAKMLENEAREMELRAKEIYAQSKVAYSNACKLESESHSLLDLAEFYCRKAHECYKNTTKNCKDNNKCKLDTHQCSNKGIVSNSSSRCITPNCNS